MVLSTRGPFILQDKLCNNVEQVNKAWTKKLYCEIPIFSGISIASQPGQKNLIHDFTRCKV